MAEEKKTEAKAMFTVGDFDSDGDVTSEGVFLHFGDVRVKVADNKENFGNFIEHLQRIDKEIKENY